jgi:hypothetical protein
MKFTSSILVVTLAAGSAMAQSAIAPINAARHAAEVSSGKTAESSKVLNEEAHAKAANTNTPKTPFAPRVPAKPVANAPAAAAKPASNAGKPAVNAAKSEPKKEETQKEANAKVVQPEMKKMRGDERDPFLSIIRTADKTSSVPCVSGKKCLVIGDIILRGIVKSPNEIIAVVENSQKKTYFLHENDPVFNGMVAKITGESVVFREQTVDKVGKTSTREIVKHLNTRPIA